MKNYSSGMYVRLGFSVAINVDPDILLVDEVLAVGDEAVPTQVLGEVRRPQARAGKTIVVVSHALGTMRTSAIGSRCSSTARSSQVGPAEHVIDTYLGDVHVDRVADGEHGTRWGSGEGRIDTIELLDAAEEPVATVRHR